MIQSRSLHLPPRSIWIKVEPDNLFSIGQYSAAVHATTSLLAWLQSLASRRQSCTHRNPNFPTSVTPSHLPSITPRADGTPQIQTQSISILCSLAPIPCTWSCDMSLESPFLPLSNDISRNHLTPRDAELWLHLYPHPLIHHCLPTPSLLSLRLGRFWITLQTIPRALTPHTLDGYGSSSLPRGHASSLHRYLKPPRNGRLHTPAGTQQSGSTYDPHDSGSMWLLIPQISREDSLTSPKHHPNAYTGPGLNPATLQPYNPTTLYPCIPTIPVASSSRAWDPPPKHTGLPSPYKNPRDPALHFYTKIEQNPDQVSFNSDQIR